MGADLEGADAGRQLLERADAALEALGVPRGALASLMAGAGQVQRSPDESGWRWSGDFPLTEAAQTVLGVALAAEFVGVHGPPAAVLGESMGEAAAFCASGALELEPAVQLVYLWARALQQASDLLGLRMAVVELDDPARRNPLLARIARGWSSSNRRPCRSGRCRPASSPPWSAASGRARRSHPGLE